jgi:photosystem II stability/assembly factor-like uncharacterized protein
VGGTQWEEVLNSQEFFGTTEKVYIHWIEVAPSDANRVYALASIQYYSQGILLRSFDGGDTWSRSNSIVDGHGACLAVDPHNPLRIYVGTWYRGVYRSTDGGSTWQAINHGLPTSWAPFMAVAVDPTNSQRVYLGMEGAVYYSGNGGDSWIRVANVLSTEDRVSRIAIDPQDPRNIYAAVGWSDGFRLVSWDPERVEVEGGGSGE